MSLFCLHDYRTYGTCAVEDMFGPVGYAVVLCCAKCGKDKYITLFESELAAKEKLRWMKEQK